MESWARPYAETGGVTYLLLLLDGTAALAKEGPHRNMGLTQFKGHSGGMWAQNYQDLHLTTTLENSSVSVDLVSNHGLRGERTETRESLLPMVV